MMPSCAAGRRYTVVPVPDIKGARVAELGLPIRPVRHIQAQAVELRRCVGVLRRPHRDVRPVRLAQRRGVDQLRALEHAHAQLQPHPAAQVVDRARRVSSGRLGIVLGWAVMHPAAVDALVLGGVVGRVEKGGVGGGRAAHAQRRVQALNTRVFQLRPAALAAATSPRGRHDGTKTPCSVNTLMAAPFALLPPHTGAGAQTSVPHYHMARASVLCAPISAPAQSWSAGCSTGS